MGGALDVHGEGGVWQGGEVGAAAVLVAAGQHRQASAVVGALGDDVVREGATGVGRHDDVGGGNRSALQWRIHEMHAAPQRGEFGRDGLVDQAMVRGHFDVDGDGVGQRLIEQQHHLTEQAVARAQVHHATAAEVLARLRNPSQGAPLFALNAQAQCQLAQAEVSAPVLEPAAKPAAPAAAPPPPPAKGGAEHADLEASYRFQCAHPAQLRSLELGLFDVYKRIQRIEVQVAGQKGQAKVTLRRPARSVTLTR